MRIDWRAGPRDKIGLVSEFNILAAPCDKEAERHLVVLDGRVGLARRLKLDREQLLLVLAPLSRCRRDCDVHSIRVDRDPAGRIL